LAPVIAASPIKFSLGGLGTTVIDLADIAGYEDVVLTGTYSRELHRIATAELAAFFAIPAYTLTDDGDGIGIWYEELIDSNPAERGGRRQATPTTFVDAAPLVLPPNTEIPSSKLFKFSTEPEKIPGCIPLCRRIGTYLVFIDGTVVEHAHTATLGGEGAIDDLLARYVAHINGSAENHAAGAITSTPYSWIAAANVGAVINEIVDDLAAVAGTTGAARVGNLASPSTLWDWFSTSASTLQTQLAAVFAAINHSLPTHQTNVNPAAVANGSDSIYYNVTRGVNAPSCSASWKQIVSQDYADIGSSHGIQSAIPWVAPNYRDVAGREWVDVCPGWFWYNPGYGKPCFYAVARNFAGYYQLDHIASDSSGIGNVDVVVDWVATYPNALPIAIASNGKYVYILTVDSGTKQVRMFQYDCYTVPTAAPTLYKNEHFDAIEAFDGSSYYKTSIAVGTNTLAFTAKHSTGTLSADEFLVIVSQADITSWSHGLGNVGLAAEYDEPQGACVHIGDDAYMFTVVDTAYGHSYACAAQATVVGGLVTGVITPTLGPSTPYDFGQTGFSEVRRVESAVFDGANVWFAASNAISVNREIFVYHHVGSTAALEAERWAIAFDLYTNTLVDATAYAPLRLAFDGARVWITARETTDNRICMMSFDPAMSPNETVPGFPAVIDRVYLNPPRTATWAGSGPVAGEGPGKMAIIADIAMVIGRRCTPDGILHRVCNLSRRGGRYVA
jgi:hypothetical protein